MQTQTLHSCTGLGFYQLMLSQWQKLYPLHWNCLGNDWCYLLRIIINSITDPRRLERTVGLILSNLLLQPESDNADQVAQAFFPVGSWKNPCMSIAHLLWTTVRSLIAYTVIFFSFISHLNIPISAWSNTGWSIPGCQECNGQYPPSLDLLSGLLLTQPSILPAHKVQGELTEHSTGETTGV